MFKKIFFILGILLLGLALYYKFDRYNLRQEFLAETIGSNQIKQVKFLDEWSEGDFAGSGFLQVYIYEIKNLNKIKCDLFTDYAFVDKLNFYEIEKKYLTMEKINNCQKTKMGDNANIVVIIQNNILIIRRFGTGISSKSDSKLKEFLDNMEKLSEKNKK